MIETLPELLVCLFSPDFVPFTLVADQLWLERIS